MGFNPIVIEKGLNAGFAREMAQFQAARNLNPGLMAAAMMIPSSAAYEKLGWVGAMPAVKQWIGEKQATEFEDYDYTVKNLDWETSIPINENDVDDDQTGAISMFPAMLARRIAAHPEKLAVNLLIDGDTKLAYDGVAFFSDVSAPRTIDNLLAGSGYTTASTRLANMEKDLNAALVAMAKFTDDQGEPLGLQGNLIVTPVALERDFRRLVQSQYDPTASAVGTYNPYDGIQVIGDSRLDADDTTDWYLLCTNEIIKPLVFSMRQQAKNSFEKKNLTKTWVWSADYRGNGGYGLPHLAIKTVNS
jgi:phage major head subunit gpT-like protein